MTLKNSCLVRGWIPLGVTQTKAGPKGAACGVRWKALKTACRGHKGLPGIRGIGNCKMRS